MTTETVKGFNDFTGKDAITRAEIKKILINTFEKYGFEPAETPIVEYEEFVKKGNEQDEAISDIFKLKDKGKRNLALRYEFTFQLKRIMKNQKLPYKRYEIGEVFRDEPVSSNRFRQFIQCDADIVGSTIKEEAEILALANEVLEKLGIKPIIYFNNRKLLSSLLEIFGLENELKKKDVLKALDELDKKKIKEIKKKYSKEVGDWLTKLNSTLRLNNLDKLKEYYQGICKNKGKDYNQTLFAKAEKEIEELKKYCKYYGVDIKFQPTLARGLSYYNGTIFEIKTSGVKETIVGGGSFMFNNIQSTGISLGLDRLFSIAKIKPEKEQFMIVSLNQDKEAIRISQKLRKTGKLVMIYYGKPSKALEYANSKEIEKVIFVGEKEVKSKKFKVKDMKTGKEKICLD